MPLTQAAHGKTMVVSRITGGGDVRRHLSNLGFVEGGEVTVINDAGAVRRRIMDMGITRGVDVRVRKVAPLGDPVEITVRGYELSIRKEDAASIEVE